MIRELTTTEMSIVSGAAPTSGGAPAGYMSYEMITLIHQDAQHVATIEGLGLGTLAGLGGYCILGMIGLTTAAPIVGAVTALSVGVYTYELTYNSDPRWPWN